VFCAYQTVLVCSVVFCLVRALHKFSLSLSRTDHTTNGDQCKKGHVVKKTNVFTSSICFFSQLSWQVLKDCIQLCRLTEFFY
jgi:hypothetical protein